MLAEKRYITHNTCKLKFDLPDQDMRLGLPIGQHISFMVKDAEGKEVIRSYTPTSDDRMTGSVEFVIKIYPEVCLALTKYKASLLVEPLCMYPP